MEAKHVNAKHVNRFTRGGDPYKKLRLGRLSYKNGDEIAVAAEPLITDRGRTENKQVWVEVTGNEEFTVWTTTDKGHEWGGDTFDNIEDAMSLFYDLADRHDEVEMEFDKYDEYYGRSG